MAINEPQPTQPPSGIQTAYVEIIYGCNYACDYCYIGQEKNHANPQVPSSEEIRKTLEELKDMGVKEVIFLGGEPLIHPEIEQLCKIVEDVGFDSKGVVSNGSIMSDELASTLSKTGFWVNITIRGDTNHLFDSIADAEDTFDSAIEALRILDSHNVPIGVEYDCTPRNYDRLYQAISKIEQENLTPRIVQLHRIIPSGDAANFPEEYRLSLSQWEEVFSQATTIRSELDIPVVFEDGFPLCLIDSQYWDMIIPCGCGHNQITVSPGGAVRECPCKNESIGNIPPADSSGSKCDILENGRDGPPIPQPCQECDLQAECRSGCSASGQNGEMDRFANRFEPIKGTDADDHRSGLIYCQNLKGSVSTEENDVS